jgi:protein gp37
MRKTVRSAYIVEMGEDILSSVGNPVERLLQPLEWKKPRMIFVNSMSDLFHKEVPNSHISRVFDTMEKANWHIYQVLTKRSSLLRKFINLPRGR